MEKGHLAQVRDHSQGHKDTRRTAGVVAPETEWNRRGQEPLGPQAPPGPVAVTRHVLGFTVVSVLQRGPAEHRAVPGQVPSRAGDPTLPQLSDLSEVRTLPVAQQTAPPDGWVEAGTHPASHTTPCVVVGSRRLGPLDQAPPLTLVAPLPARPLGR